MAKLIGKVRDLVSVPHNGIRTEPDWIKHFILYHKKRHRYHKNATGLKGRRGRALFIMSGLIHNVTIHNVTDTSVVTSAMHRRSQCQPSPGRC